MRPIPVCSGWIAYTSSNGCMAHLVKNQNHRGGEVFALTQSRSHGMRRPKTGRPACPCGWLARFVSAADLERDSAELAEAAAAGLAGYLATLQAPIADYLLFGFLCAIVFTWVGELFGADRLAEKRFHEIDVRAYTGLGAEPAAPTI